MQIHRYPAAMLAIALGASFTIRLARADYAAQILSLNPDQYWRLNETSGATANNAVGSGVPAAYDNTALGLSGPRPPAFPGFDSGNNAPEFNGVDSAVTTGSALLDNQSAFTLLGWFYQTANQASSRTGLFGQNNAIEFGFIDTNTLQLYTESPLSFLDIPWDGSLNNTWVFAAAVGDGMNNRVYLNGALAGSLVAATSNYSASGFAFNIGDDVFDASPFANNFNGQIDEVTIFNNRALTAAEIRTLYDAALAVPEPTGWTLFTCGGAIACCFFRFRRRRAH